MYNKNEKKLLQIIKYSSIIIVVVFAIVMNYVLFQNEKNRFKKDIENLRKNFTEVNKNKIKDEINHVFHYISYEKRNSEKHLKDDLKNKINEAYNIMEKIYFRYKGIETEEEVKQRIIDALRSFNYNGSRGYFFIITLDAKSVLFPNQPQMEGKDFWNYQDAQKKYKVREMISLLDKNEQAFLNWHWYRPYSDKEKIKKIGMIKKFTPYNWFVGTGEYLEDYESEIQEKVLDYISTIRYGKNGYIFVYDYSGESLSHIKKSYIGKKIYDITQKDNAQKVMDIAKKGDGFISYIGTVKPDTNLPAEKISFVKGFEQWKWLVGTGFYTDELEKKIEVRKKEFEESNKNHLLKLMLITLALSAVFFLITFYISVILKKRFVFFEKKVKEQIVKNRKKDQVVAQQAKMAALGEMLQNIAHQWRQPLSLISILSSTIRLKKETETLDNEYLLESLDTITESSKYLSNTIDDFRDIFNNNKKFEGFELKETFEKLFNLVEKQLEAHKITLVKDIEYASIVNYQSKFIQVLINILNNSKDELVKKDEENRLIFIRTRVLKNKVLVEIKDNAGGIKEEILDKIYEPYFTTKHQSQGTGIGLYMSREIVLKYLKGDIKTQNIEYEYKNKKYKGALTIITLSTQVEF